MEGRRKICEGPVRLRTVSITSIQAEIPGVDIQCFTIETCRELVAILIFGNKRMQEYGYRLEPYIWLLQNNATKIDKF